MRKLREHQCVLGIQDEGIVHDENDLLSFGHAFHVDIQDCVPHTGESIKRYVAYWSLALAFVLHDNVFSSFSLNDYRLACRCQIVFYEMFRGVNYDALCYSRLRAVRASGRQLFKSGVQEHHIHAADGAVVRIEIFLRLV